MDRAISSDTQRRRRLGQWLRWLGLAGLLAAGLVGLRYALRTQVKASQLRTAVVEYGPMQHTLSGTGLVLPEREAIVTAPASTDIKAVHTSAGTVVAAGQLLMELNNLSLQQEVNSLEDQLALRRNKIQQLRLELNRSLLDLQIRDSIKALSIHSLQADLDNARRLLRVGGATQEQVDQAQLNLRIAQLEKRQLENDLRAKRQSIEMDLHESELEAQIQARELAERRRKLDLTQLKAQRAGVITWINQQVGASVREGEQVAKLADLSSYRLEGSIADLYAGRVQVGMRVQANLNNDTLLGGVITNVRPAVDNGVVSFEVQLDNPRHPLLRPNLRVELYIITESRERVLRVANGPAFTGKSSERLFVLSGDGHAQRRTVPIGLVNFEYVELRDQVQAGDVVIISDLSDYQHLTQLTLK